MIDVSAFQSVLEPVEQRLRGHHRAGTQAPHHDFVTQALRDHGRDHDVGAEDDNHETIVKTSSSV